MDAAKLVVTSPGAVVSPTPRHADPRLAALIVFYEALAPADLDRLEQIYCADARFKDPFNEVQGTAAIRRIFAHMFASTQTPRFVVHDGVADAAQAFLTWDFSFVQARLGPQLVLIRGSTHVRFAADGRVAMHRDYWDAAEELYEKLPVLGAVMRFLRRRGAA